MTASSQYLSELASKCQGVARCLTFNDDEHQEAAKHTLLAASHALDGESIRVHKKRDGLLIINASLQIIDVGLLILDLPFEPLNLRKRLL